MRKIIYVCQQAPYDDKNWHCTGLVNVFAFGSHICSHPSFAPGDLLHNRPERLYALEKLFKIKIGETPEIIKVIIDGQSNDVKMFKDSERFHKAQPRLKKLYERYRNLIDEFKGK